MRVRSRSSVVMLSPAYTSRQTSRVQTPHTSSKSVSGLHQQSARYGHHNHSGISIGSLRYPPFALQFGSGAFDCFFPVGIVHTLDPDLVKHLIGGLAVVIHE